jgi:beta-galactosidase
MARFVHQESETVEFKDRRSGVVTDMLHLRPVTIACFAFLLVQGIAWSRERTRERFDEDWRFFKGDPAAAQGMDFDDRAWRGLDLPHDWSIEEAPDPKMPEGRQSGFFPGGVAWYRKRFTVPADTRGCRVIIEFDGIYHRSDVYINGKHLGHRPYGYVSFQYDLTPHIRYDGANILAVRVDHSDAPTSRWYSGSGIYRHVWLTTCDPLHVARWGTWVTTPQISSDSASVRIRTSIQNESGQTATYTLVTAIDDPEGRHIEAVETEASTPAGGSSDHDQTMLLRNPQRWSVDEPRVYMVRTSLREGGQVRDTYRTSFGIREARFDARKGFILNGRQLKLKGVCLHQDAGCLGAAVPERAWERRLLVLRDMGCNAIRMSHNPPAPELLDLCDRTGFLVMDEAFDKWRSDGYYGKLFNQWWKADLDAMLLRDRNHPSIVIWSVGNEVGEQGRPEGTEIARQLVDHVHRRDPTRPVTYASVPDRKDRCVNNNGFAEAFDVVGYNYQEDWYKQDKQEHPDRIVLGTECYPFFRRKARSGGYDLVPVNPWYDVVAHDWVAGQFIWPGFDYLGESTGWPSKGWCNGLIDTCGFPKARAGFHRAAWRSDPVVQIAVLDDSLDIDHGRAAWGWPKMARHWNFPTRDRVIRVQAFTNCRTVELICNDKSFGRRESANYPNSTIEWDVPYEMGRLRAIGGNGAGPLATDEIRTAGSPAAIVLRPDRTSIRADAQDICNLEVNLVDKDGVLVPNSDRLISFDVVGAGRLIGTDNGDLRGIESYRSPRRTTRWGRCLAVVQASRSPGTITVRGTSEGLPPATVVLSTAAGS